MTDLAQPVKVLYITTQFEQEARMTHLEMLAERLDKNAEWAISMATHSRNKSRPLRSEYYHGQVVAYGLAADILRRASLDREGMVKEEAG